MTANEYIKELRIKRWLTQTKFAKLIGVHFSMLCKIEKNERPLTLKTLVNIINVLDLTLLETRELFKLLGVEKDIIK